MTCPFWIVPAVCLAAVVLLAVAAAVLFVAGTLAGVVSRKRVTAGRCAGRASGFGHPQQ